MLFGLKLRQKNYDAARNLLVTERSADDDEARFVAIQEVNLDFLTDEESFTLSTTQETFLYETAHSSLRYSHYARALWALLKNEIIIPDEDLDIQGQQSLTAPPTDNLPAESLMGKLQVYPNPAQTNVEVLMPQEVKHGVLRIVDINGKMVHTRVIEEGEYQISLPLAHLNKGIYFIGLWQENAIKYHERLIINR